MDIVNEWIQNNQTDEMKEAEARAPKHLNGYFQQAYCAKCADGFTVSIQAGKAIYCTPRESNAYPYSTVELGFPSERPTDAIMEYIDGGPDDDPTKTVFGYVPVELVVALLKAHGGIVGRAWEDDTDA